MRRRRIMYHYFSILPHFIWNRKIHITKNTNKLTQAQSSLSHILCPWVEAGESTLTNHKQHIVEINKAISVRLSIREWMFWSLKKSDTFSLIQVYCHLCLWNHNHTFAFELRMYKNDDSAMSGLDWFLFNARWTLIQNAQTATQPQPILSMT